MAVAENPSTTAVTVRGLKIVLLRGGEDIVDGIGLVHGAVPVLSALSISPSRFRATGARHSVRGAVPIRTGTTVAYRDSLGARTSLQVLRAVSGRRVGGTTRAAAT